MTSKSDTAQGTQECVLSDQQKLGWYSRLFFVLQSEPRYIALLFQYLPMTEVDSFLQTVMFTIYSNQHELREERLLLNMIHAVFASYFDKATETSFLLRANSPASRMVMAYTRQSHSQKYLKTVLADQIRYVCEHACEHDLEVDLLRVYDEVYCNSQNHADGNHSTVDMPRCVSSETAASDPQVLAIIRHRMSAVSCYANSLLDYILEHLDLVPYGLRWIAKQIRDLTRKKIPDVEDTFVRSLTGAFFFLRFINPAIVTPQSYMLVDHQLKDKPRRALTLIAKMIQKIVNKQKYSAESYEEIFSLFFDDNKARVDKFLDDLCEVPELHEYDAFNNYDAFHGSDLSLSITANEIYGTHQLLERHQHLFCSEKSSLMTIILQKLGPAPEVLPETENYTLNLPLYPCFEAEIEDFSRSFNITEDLMAKARSMTAQMSRSVPNISHSVAARPYDIHSIAEYAVSSSVDSSLNRKGTKPQSLIDTEESIVVSDSRKSSGNESTNSGLDQQLQVSSQPARLPQRSAAALTLDVESEVNRFHWPREKAERDLRSLEIALQIVAEHNRYLKSQLKSYTSYLANARLQSRLSDKS